MVSSAATSVEQYLSELPPERREVMTAMRAFIQRHLPPGYVEAMVYGMIGYSIPLERYPDTHNGQPLAYVCLAAQKNYCALYLFGPYSDASVDAALRAGFAAANKKLDMGKSCLRFRSMDELALDAVGAAIGSTPAERSIELYEAGRAELKSAKPTSAKKKKPA